MQHCHLFPCRETLAGKRIIRHFHLPCTVASASTAANAAAIAALLLRRGRIVRGARATGMCCAGVWVALMSEVGAVYS